MKKFDKLAVLLTGIVYLTVGVIIILKPKFLYYCVAAAFFMQGVVSIYRFATDKK